MIDYSEHFTMSNCRLDNLDIEVKKIIAAHNGLMFHMRKCYFDDGGWHNLRAFLINRVEQITNYKLIVAWDDDDAYPNYRIVDRRKYLKEKYNIDWYEKEK